MNRAKLLGFLLAFAGAACGPTPTVGTPLRAEGSPVSPTDLLPTDLDFVIRIDAARLRDHPLMVGLVRGGEGHLRDVMLAGDSASVVRLVLPEIEQARSIVIGGRLTADGYRGDGVVAVEQGAGEAPRRTFARDPGLSRLRAASRRVELYERASAARDEAALYVVIEGKGLVLATPVEMDAVLRVLRDGPDRDRLAPPPRGLLSFAGRLRTGDKPPPATRAVSLREIGAGLVRYAGSIEADDVLRIEADLVYESEKQAVHAVELGRQMLDRLALLGPQYGSLADSGRLALVGPVVGLRLSVPFALIAGLH